MGIPKKIRSELEKQQWYLKIRYAAFVVNAWLFFRPAVKKELRQQKFFYRKMLEHIEMQNPSLSKLIFDIGANEGFHTEIFRDLGYKVIAVEPASRNIAILNARFHNNKEVKIIAAAAANNVDTIDFLENRNDYAMGTLSLKWSTLQSAESAHVFNKIKVQTTSLDHLINEYGIPAFIKIDVEGFEEQVLKGLTRTVPAMVSFEAILPDFLQETKNSIDHLLSLNSNAIFNYTTNEAFELPQFVDAKTIIKCVEKSLSTINIYCK